MHKFCVSCGSELSGGSFCASCGEAVTRSEPTVDSATAPPVAPGLAPSGVQSEIAGMPPRKRRVGMAIAAGAVALSVGALTVFAINTQAQNGNGGNDQVAAAEAQEQALAEQEAAEKAEKKRIKAEAKKIADKKVAKLEAEQQPASQPSVPSQSSTQYATGASASGYWSGSMKGGQYSFSLDLYDEGGSLSGSMYQVDNTDGDDGTQQMTGYREGNTLYLRGTSWSGAPSSWGLDSIVVTLSSDGSSFSGSYGCDVCSGTNDIYGSRNLN